MPSTYLSLHYHLVFSTKNRVPWIQSLLQNRLHEYLGGTVNRLGGLSQGVGGVEDHVHLLVGLKATHCLSDFMRELKKASSSWAKHELTLPDFAWQDGYSAFSVSATSRAGVQKYIAQQVAHHRVKSFREELIELLELAGISYDAKYLD